MIIKTMDDQMSPVQPVPPVPPASPPAGKSKDWLKISQIFIGFLIVLGLFGNIYLLTRKQTPLEQAKISPTPTPTQIFATPTIENFKFEDVLSEVKTEFESNYKGSKIIYPLNSSLWWISPEGLNIINNSVAVELQLECGPQSEPLNEALTLLIPKIDTIFKKNGYELNILNSSKSLTDHSFYDYIKAYEKGNIKCTFVGSPDCAKYENEEIHHQSVLVMCTDKYDDNYKQQSPYLKDLGIKDAVINISKNVNNFIYYYINWRRTGAYGIAKNENGKWIKLYEGQDSPSCDVVNKYKIPKEIIKVCVASDGSNQPNLN